MKRSKMISCLLVAMFVANVFTVFTPTPVSAAPVTQQNSSSHGPLPDELLFNVYTDEIAEYYALKANMIDLMDGPLPAALIPDALNEMVAGNFYLSEQPDNAFFYWGIHCEESRYPLNDTAFRKAMAYMVDKPSIVANALGGYGYVIDSVVPAGIYGAWSNLNVTKYQYSLDMAAKTLFDSGYYYTGNHDSFPFSGGAWYDKNNAPLRPIWIINRADDVARKFAGEQLDEAMTQIDMPHTRTQGSSAYVSAVVWGDPHGSWDMFTGGWGLDSEPTYLWDFFNSASSEFYNIVFWNNATYDYWSNKFLSDSLYADAQVDAYMCQELIADAVPYIVLYQRQAITAARTSWQDMVDQTGVGFMNFYSLLQAHKAGTSQGGQLRVGLGQDVGTLNPVITGWLWDWFVLDEIYDRLARRDPYTLEWRPWMAESFDAELFSWTPTEQGLKITLNLRGNLFWHDGINVTSQDVEFTYRWLAMPPSEGGIGAPRYLLPFVIDRIETPTPLTAIVYCNTTSYFALSYLMQFPMLPEHIWSKYTTLEEVQAVRPELTGELIGSGPYVFVQRIPGESISLIANTNYFARIPEEVDVTPPTTSISAWPRYVGEQGTTYVTSDTGFTLSATDDLSGVLQTYYRINEDNWTPYANGFRLIGADGVYDISYFSVDVAGNVEQVKSLTVNLASLKVSSCIAGFHQPITHFDAIFVKIPCLGYMLVATVPGEFFYAVEVTNNWPIATNMMWIGLAIPSDFKLRGVNPIHVYLDGVDVTSQCTFYTTFNGTIIAIADVPTGSAVRVTTCMTYALKGTIYPSPDSFAVKGYAFNAFVLAYSSDADNILFGTYTSSANVIAHPMWRRAIAGFVTDINGNAIPGATVELIGLFGNASKTTVTDVNGFYYFTDIHAGIFTVRVTLGGATYSQSVAAICPELAQVDFKI